MTFRQAETLVRDKAHSKKKAKKKKETNKCEGKVKVILGAGDPSLNLEAVNCQYSMAQRFVRSILNWKCPNPRKDYGDIADVILERLSEHLEYIPIGNEDRKSQQMRILADVFACWISDILIKVSDKHRAQLEEECLRRRREEEERAVRLELQKDEDDEDDDDDAESKSADDDEEDEEEEDEEKRLDESASRTKPPGEGPEEGEGTVEEEGGGGKPEDETEASFKVESSTQYEDKDLEGQVLGEKDEELLKSMASMSQIEAEKSKTIIGADPMESEAEDEDEFAESELDEAASMFLEEEEELVEAEQQTDGEAKMDAGTETEKGDAESKMDAAKSREQQEMEKMISRMGETFETDVPFITFGKVFDTLYTMIESEVENSLEDPVDNRIHRAIYEKCEKVMRLEDPKLLNERMKDVVDVTTGKVAKWLRKTLNEQQIKFLVEHPPGVESKEVRDWSRWIGNVADMAEDWSSWINKVTAEAGSIKEKGQMTRGAWQDWTSKFESNALLWRRTYLEAVHQEHHNTMMLCDRKVMKTGTMKKQLFSEATINNTNFDSLSKMP